MRFNRYSIRDLSAVRQCIVVAEEVKDVLSNLDIKIENRYCPSELPKLSGLLEILQSALVDELPTSYKAGSVIKGGYSEELDQIKFLVDDGHSLIANLQTKYIAQYGINTLKIKNNDFNGGKNGNNSRTDGQSCNFRNGYNA